MIVIVYGLPGSGKSFFASRLAEKVEAVYLSSDRIRKDLFPSPKYTGQEKQEVYDVMLRKATELKGNANIVLDGTFYKEMIRNRFRNTLGWDGQLYFIEVKAPEEVVRERLKHDRPYSDANFSTYRKIKEQWEDAGVDHLVLESADDNVDEMLMRAMKYIKG